MLRNQLFVCLHLVFFTACPALLSADETTGYRIWEDRTAQFRVEAAFLKRVENQIQLKRKDNGKVITVPLNRLSGKDNSSTSDPTIGTQPTLVSEEMQTFIRPLRPQRLESVPGWNPRWTSQEFEDEMREREALLMRMYN